MKDQSQIDQMRAAIRGDRERALARIRADGREPIFPRADEAAESAAEPSQPEQAILARHDAEQPDAKSRPIEQPVTESRSVEQSVAESRSVEQPVAESRPVEQPMGESPFLARLRALFHGERFRARKGRANRSESDS